VAALSAMTLRLTVVAYRTPRTTMGLTSSSELSTPSLASKVHASRSFFTFSRLISLRDEYRMLSGPPPYTGQSAPRARDCAASLARHRHPQQRAVGAGLAQSPVALLEVPGQDAAVIGRVVVQRLASGDHVVHAHRHGARETALVGHGVRVRVQARVVGAPAAHVVALHPAGVLPVLPVKLFGGDFG